MKNKDSEPARLVDELETRNADGGVVEPEHEREALAEVMSIPKVGAQEKNLQAARKEIEALGMGLLLGVARGSSEPALTPAFSATAATPFSLSDSTAASAAPA